MSRVKFSHRLTFAVFRKSGLHLRAMQAIGKTLIIFGVILIVIGAMLTFINKIPFLGKLPGDICIQKKNFTFYFPLATSILISILLSLVFYLLSKK